MALPIHMIRATAYCTALGVVMQAGDSMPLRQWIFEAQGNLRDIVGCLKSYTLIISLDGVDLDIPTSITACNDMWPEKNVPQKEMDADLTNYDQVDVASLTLVPRASATYQEGLIWYNADRHVFQMYTDIPDTMLDVGEETRTRIVNKTGGPLLNGDVVRISGASGSKAAIALADADSDAETDATIGMLTMDLADNDEGYAVSVGTVHDLDTNAYPDGTVLYLSQTPGKWTSTKPLQPASVVQIGIVQNQHQNQGEILVDIRKLWAKDIRQISKTDTGWAPNAGLDSYYEYTTRKVTVTNNGAVTAYAFWHGSVVHTLAPGASYVSAAHGTADGRWFLSYNGTAWTWSQDPWTFDLLMTGYVKYVAATPSNSYGVTETHSLMDPNAHEEFHQVNGTYKLSGGTFSGYVLGSYVSANRQVDIGSVSLKDEDCITTNALLTGATGAYTLGYIAAGGVFTFIDAQDHVVPSGATVPTWNNASTGALTPLTANQRMNVWVISIPTMKDVQSQKKRFVLLAGQVASTNATTVANENPNLLNLGDLATLSAEWNITGRIQLQYVVGQGWKLESVSEVSGTKSYAVSTAVVGLSTVAHDSTLSGDGTAGTPLAVVPSLIYQTYPLSLGTSWPITHTMISPAPAVTVIDSSGNHLGIEVVYTGPTTLTITAGHAMSGTAYLS